MLVSDATWHSTGYGIQVNELAHRMAADGHGVCVFAPGAFFGAKVQVAPNITVYGAGMGDDRWGNATLSSLMRWIQPNLVLTWLDLHGMVQYGFHPEPTFMWAPIDTWPVPKIERAILSRAVKILVPSRWGQDVLAQHGFASEYVPCGLRVDDFYIDPDGRERWRQGFEADADTFVIGMVGYNIGHPDRKGYGYAFDLIGDFVARHPGEPIRVYIHTDPVGGDGAINLVSLREEMGLDGVIAFAPPGPPYGATIEYMRHMYNGLDLFLHTSLTEGFGLPVLEAQACGTPVLANAATSVTELVRTGWLKKPAGSMWVNTCTKIFPPNVPALGEVLEEAYHEWRGGNGRYPRETCREKVLDFDWDRIYPELWRPILADVPLPISYDEHGPRRLMLGAGKIERPGFVHHDKERYHSHIDIAHDLNVLPWPWEDDSWDYIEFSDCIEHLRARMVEIMDELWRIIAPGGYVCIHTVEAGSWQLWTDPSHVRGFSLESFDYFDPTTRFGDTYSYSNRKWKVCKKTMDVSGLLFVLQPRKVESHIELYPTEATV